MSGASHAGIRAGTTQGGQQLGFAEVATGAEAARAFSFAGPPSGVVYVSLYSSATHDASVAFDDVVLEVSGTYLLTGTPAILTKGGRIMPAAAGTYVMTGTNATLRISRRIAADPGLYTTIGTPARVLVGRAISAAPGSYLITPSDASITVIHGHFVHAERGSYAFAGSDARLIYGRKMAAASSSYVLTGTDTSWVYRRMIKAAPEPHQPAPDGR
jgi:hypothetical protein